MFNKVFIVIVIITISCDLSLARLKDCRDGENYWCESEIIAKKCQKEEYCQRIWYPIDEVMIERVMTEIPIPTLPSVNINAWPYVISEYGHRGVYGK